MILILGASGYVGSAIQQSVTARYLPHSCISRSKIDYTCKDTFNELIQRLRPKIVINCAGVTGKPNVDACELQKSECLYANSYLPCMLSEVCLSNKVTFGHVSSGCIFTGHTYNMTGSVFGSIDIVGYNESHIPNFSFRYNNCSWYSGCKALAEEMLPIEDIYVWRLRIPFNHENNKRNYLCKLLNYETLLNSKNSISHLGDFADACVESLIKEIPKGIYNIVNTGYVSTLQVTNMINSYSQHKKEFKFFKSEADFLKTVKTPRSNCILDNSKLLKAGIYIRPVEEALLDSIKNLRQ